MKRTKYNKTPGEVAAFFGVHTETVREWCRKKKIQRRKVGGVWRIHEDELREDEEGDESQ